MLTREQVDDTIKKMPAFSIHEDNFFVTGIPLDRHIDGNSADAKYQISFKILLTRNTLPLDSYLFLTYTQKAFWNIYKFSSPFEEINFNPTLGLAKPTYTKNGLANGLAVLQLEHESNGRDSIFSRSWNNLSLSYHRVLNDRTTIKVKAWLPFLYKSDNPDLLDYIGLGEASINYEIKPQKLLLNMTVRKGLDGWKGAVKTQLLYRPFKMPNQYIMLEWFNGYTESLIDYQEFQSMVRVGFVIKADQLDIFKTKNRKFN
ncbi:MAG: phospholipase A [Leeuwenhoekiella sp.]